MIENLKHRFDRLFASDGFSKAVTTLLSGTFLALLISYAAQPVLTRLYSPEAFGLFDTFVSIVGLLLPFASLRYEDAIMLPDEDEEAQAVLGLSFSLVILTAFLSAGFAFFQGPIGRLFGSPNLGNLLIWVPPIFLAIRFAKLTELWLNRKKRYKHISAGQIAQSTVMASLRIILAKGTATQLPFGLIWGYFAGHIASTAWYARAILRTQAGFIVKLTRGSRIKEAAQRFKRFPAYAMPSTLLNALQSRLPFLLLLFFFDESTVGYFGRAFALFAVPLSLIGNAISQVYFVEGARAKQSATLSPLTRKVHGQLVAIGFFPTLALMLTGPEVMGFILGANWTQAGVYIQWLAPWFFLASVASPITRLFDILERQKLDLLASLLMFVVQTTLFVIGGLTGDLQTTLLLLAAGGIIARLIHIGIMLALAGISFRNAATPYVRQMLYALPFLVVLFFVQGLAIPWLTTLSVTVCCAGFALAAFSRAGGS